MGPPATGTPANATPESAVGRATETPTPRRRIAGIDLARALAIIGMLAVHVGPTGAGGWDGRLYALPHGRASILFVLLAGVGVSLLARSRSHSTAEARGKLVWRALVLVPLGLLLQELDHRVFVILHTYGALFLVAVAVLGLPRRALVALAALLWALGPVLYLLGTVLAPEPFARRAVGWSDDGAQIAISILAAGPYPLPVWSVPLVVGMLIGRLDLRASWVRLGLVVGGAAAAFAIPPLAAVLADLLPREAAASPWAALLDAAPHSQMPPWLLSSLGSAALVLGLSLLLADALPRLASPLVALGQLALTIYVAHLMALHWWSPLLRSSDVGEAARSVIVVTIIAAVFALLWRARAARGPLETILDLPWHLRARWRRDRAPARGEGSALQGMIVGRRSTMPDKVHLSDEEWRRRLTPEEFRVLRQHGTEAPFAGCFVGTKEPGTYVCAACGNPLFASGEKFESGTGWPSFTRPVGDDAVSEHVDHSYGMLRTEVRCARCDSHLGHVFDDGPPPTGLRYCMNSVAMRHVLQGEPIDLVDG
jgi:methionine-R-sulfoxide reductase